MRILTGLIGAPLVAGMAWLGGWWFAALFMGIVVLAQHEVYGLFAKSGGRPGGWTAPVGVAALMLTPVEPLLGYVALAGLIGVVVTTPLRAQSPRLLEDVAGTLFGMVYPAVFLVFLVVIRVRPPVAVANTFALTIGIIFLIWTSDTAAYYAGRTLGRHKMAPSISPGKTWEGAVGGLAGAIASAVVFGIWFVPDLAIEHWMVLGLIAGVFGPIGDLFESSLKRAAGVKDSANWLPGHGGMLDRFDALILVAPVAYAYLRWVGSL